jgi:hypothetical protein
MKNDFVLIGYLAALRTTFSVIPQVVRICRMKEERGHIPPDGIFRVRRDSSLVCPRDSHT